MIASLQREMGGLSSREGVSQTRTPYNIGLLKEEVSSITMRWDNVCRQVSERYLNLYYVKIYTVVTFIVLLKVF